MTIEYAIVAGGCFWCTEAVFKDVIGVESVESGYIGGTTDNPTYEQVCNGDTGHAEAIRIGFDSTSSTTATCWTSALQRTTRHSLTVRGMTSVRSIVPPFFR